ncbi:unnamed protein product, partial [Closterium sp. NIES-54]
PFFPASSTAPLVALPCPACRAALLAARYPALPVAPPCRPSAALPCLSRRPATRAPPCPACRAALLDARCSAVLVACHPPLPVASPCWPPRRPALPARRPASSRAASPACASPCWPPRRPALPARRPAGSCPALPDALPSTGRAPLFPSRAPPRPAVRASLVLARYPANPAPPCSARYGFS